MHTSSCPRTLTRERTHDLHAHVHTACLCSAPACCFYLPRCLIFLLCAHCNALAGARSLLGARREARLSVSVFARRERCAESISQFVLQCVYLDETGDRADQFV
eukprot:533686-Pleurochrysis_carterae.AAC.1